MERWIAFWGAAVALVAAFPAWAQGAAFGDETRYLLGITGGLIALVYGLHKSEMKRMEKMIEKVEEKAAADLNNRFERLEMLIERGNSKLLAQFSDERTTRERQVERLQLEDVTLHARIGKISDEVVRVERDGIRTFATKKEVYGRA